MHTVLASVLISQRITTMLLTNQLCSGIDPHLQFTTAWHCAALHHGLSSNSSQISIRHCTWQGVTQSGKSFACMQTASEWIQCKVKVTQHNMSLNNTFRSKSREAKFFFSFLSSKQITFSGLKLHVSRCSWGWSCVVFHFPVLEKSGFLIIVAQQISEAETIRSLSYTKL